MSDKTPGLYPKLAEAIADVERIHKDGTNSHFKYTYTSAEQVYKVIRKPLLERGLVVIPSVAESTVTGQSTVTKLHLRIVDSESGESLEAFWMGEGQDKGDKGPYKAATGGMKTWLKHLFLLPADDDPEADTSTDRAPTMMERLAAAADKLGIEQADRKTIGEWIHPDGQLDDKRLADAVRYLEAGKEGVLKNLVGRS